MPGSIFGFKHPVAKGEGGKVETVLIYIKSQILAQFCDDRKGKEKDLSQKKNESTTNAMAVMRQMLIIYLWLTAVASSLVIYPHRQQSSCIGKSPGG